MSDFCFRIRFIRAQSTTINIQTTSKEIKLRSLNNSITLSSRDKDKSLKDATEWVLKGSGWSSREEALDSGTRCQDALMRSFAKLRIGVEFGNRSPRSGMTKFGLKMFEKSTGRRVLNDFHGLTTYECEPTPAFAKVGNASLILSSPEQRFDSAFNYALSNPYALSDAERLSLELFFASFFQTLVDARFLLLIMAVEALIDPKLRDKQVVKFVDDLIERVQMSDGLPTQERESIIGSLRYLRKQSISQSGRELVSERLDGKQYQDLNAPAFFTKCYSIRSRLVHGNKRAPSRDELSSVVAILEVYVSDLLSFDIPDLE